MPFESVMADASSRIVPVALAAADGSPPNKSLCLSVAPPCSSVTALAPPPPTDIDV